MKKRLAALLLSVFLVIGTVAAETVTTPSDAEAPVVTEVPVTPVPVTEAPATPVPVTEAPATPVPVTEAPATPVPVTEAPATPVPVTEAPAMPVPVTEAPVTEVPVTEVPVTEVPVTEVPVTEVPVTEVPVTEAPVTEVPVTEAPVTEVPVTEVPVTEVPVTEVPVTEVPVTEVPVTEVPVTEVPVTEVPVTEVPVTEVPVTEAPATPEPFKAGLAKLAGGTSIHGGAGLSDANPVRTASSGVVYAMEVSNDGSAIKIAYHNGEGIATGWVKAGRVTMLSAGEVSSYHGTSADARDYAGYKLDPIKMHVEETEVPVTEVPVTEVPATEVPATEVPVTEVPVTEVPVTEVPVTEVPVTEVPVTEVPVTEVPATEVPATEVPATEVPVTPAPLTEPTEGSYVIEDAHIREAADGLSPIMVTIPQYTVIDAMAVEGDWVLASAEGYTGYIYIDSVKGIDHLLPTEEPTEVPEPETTPVPNMKVTIFTSRRSVMQPGETVTLTSKIEGFENYEIMYQWQWDRGNGFEDIPGANADFYAFESSIETLGYDWRLIVYYR